METNNIHPMTAIMADLMMEAYLSSEEAQSLPRELFAFHLATFLMLYETTSLVEATGTIMNDRDNAREFLEPLMKRDVNTFSQEERTRAIADSSLVVSNTLIIDKVLEVVAPFIDE